MKIQYIAGRPLTINGASLEVGDTLTQEQVDSIPRLESWTSGRFIFPVLNNKDYDNLPNFLKSAYVAKKSAAAHTERVASLGSIAGADEAQKNHEESRVVRRADAEARQQTIIYGQRAAAATDVVEQPVVTTVEPVATVTEPVATVTEPVATETVSVPDTATDDGPFDPSVHSVAEVRDYIESNPEAKDAVLAAEAQGKARKGLLGE